MNKAMKLYQKWDVATEKADVALGDLDKYLDPIIKALHPKKTVYTIERVYTSGGNMYVETHDSRDYDNWNHFAIPLEILDAKDPLKAAQEVAEKAENAKAINTQEQIRFEIERLQGLLK